MEAKFNPLNVPVVTLPRLSRGTNGGGQRHLAGSSRICRAQSGCRTFLPASEAPLDPDRSISDSCSKTSLKHRQTDGRPLISPADTQLRNSWRFWVSD